MIYRFSIITFIVLGLFSFSCSNFQKKEELKPNEEFIPINKESKFFYSVPIVKYSSNGIPCIQATIGKDVYCLRLDTGFNGAVVLSDPFFSLIEPKKYLYTTSIYDVRGCEHIQDVYLLPEIEIEPMRFLGYSLRKENEEFKKNTSFYPDGTCFSDAQGESGLVGSVLFHASNLLIDIKNSNIAFCDSIDTLSKKGYLLENFTKVPLLSDQGLVAFEAQLFNQTMRCLLDTGCTENFCKAEDLDAQSLEEAIWDTKNIKCSSVLIGSQEFESMPFRRIPIQTPFEIQAILGMTFFSNHVVFIDFINQNIYLAKADLAKSSL